MAKPKTKNNRVTKTSTRSNLTSRVIRVPKIVTNLAASSGIIFAGAITVGIGALQSDARTRIFLMGVGAAFLFVGAVLILISTLDNHK